MNRALPLVDLLYDGEMTIKLDRVKSLRGLPREAEILRFTRGGEALIYVERGALERIGLTVHVRMGRNLIIVGSNATIMGVEGEHLWPPSPR